MSTVREEVRVAVARLELDVSLAVADVGVVVAFGIATPGCHFVCVIILVLVR